MARAALAVVTLALTTSPAGAASGAASGAVRWFHSPTGNIECELAANDPRGTYAYCQTFVPTQTATLRPSGRTAVCTRRACAVGNGPAAAPVLRYGRSVRVGPFRCTSLPTWTRCVALANGHGFTIAREGVRTF